MGYTHYHYHPAELDRGKFANAAIDCKKVCAASGIKIAYKCNLRGLPVFNKEKIQFNGIGDDGHEMFLVERVDSEARSFGHPKGFGFHFCKTARKPYDLCVTACLVVLQHHFGADFEVSSDGTVGEWRKAIELCEKVLGYGKDFAFTGDY